MFQSGSHLPLINRGFFNFTPETCPKIPPDTRKLVNSRIKYCIANVSKNSISKGQS